jgi:hypothetical protein
MNNYDEISLMMCDTDQLVQHIMELRKRDQEAMNLSMNQHERFMDQLEEQETHIKNHYKKDRSGRLPHCMECKSGLDHDDKFVEVIDTDPRIVHPKQTIELVCQKCIDSNKLQYFRKEDCWGKIRPWKFTFMNGSCDNI